MVPKGRPSVGINCSPERGSSNRAASALCRRPFCFLLKGKEIRRFSFDHRLSPTGLIKILFFSETRFLRSSRSQKSRTGSGIHSGYPRLSTWATGQVHPLEGECATSPIAAKDF